MQAKNEIGQELKEASIAIPCVKMPLMDLPPYYFEEALNVHLSNAISSEFPKENPFLLEDEKYFNQLTNQILCKIDKEKIGENLPIQTPYSVPTQYFKTLHTQILDKIAPREIKKATFHISHLYIRNIAIAASWLFIMAIGFMWINSENADTKLKMQLSAIDEVEIQQYIRAHQYEFEHDIAYQTINENDVDLKNMEQEIYNGFLSEINENEYNNIF